LLTLQEYKLLTWQIRLPTRGEHGQDQDWISCRILAIFLYQDWIWILFLKNIGSGYLFDLCNEIFLRVIQDFTNDGAVVFFAMIFMFTKIKMILSVCAALITIDDNSCYFIVNIFRRGGSSKLL